MEFKKGDEVKYIVRGIIFRKLNTRKIYYVIDTRPGGREPLEIKIVDDTGDADWYLLNQFERVEKPEVE